MFYSMKGQSSSARSMERSSTEELICKSMRIGDLTGSCHTIYRRSPDEMLTTSDWIH